MTTTRPLRFRLDRSPNAVLRRRAAALLMAPLVLSAALVLPACGSDDEASDSVPTTEAPAETTETTEAAADEPASGVIEVRAVDFAYLDLPAEVEAGTQFKLVNEADAELHEFVAFKLPEDETRSVDELMQLPQEEIEALFGEGPPATVLLAKPGEPQIEAVGDGTLSEPGRYLVACAIPVGADPDELLEAEGPPPADAGVPHFHEGMYAEVTVV